MSDEQVAPETRGVAVELLATVDLGPEIQGMEGRQLRMRMVTIEPGGVFGPVHDHKGRPGTVYVLQGTITDHRDGIATDYGPGVGWPEDRNTVHWLENRGRFRPWRSRSMSSGTSRRAAAEPAVDKGALGQGVAGSVQGFLAELLLAECDDRDRRSSVRRVNAAGFPREKWLGDFDFDANPNINPATIHTLAGCGWVRRGQPLCLIGDSGTGKSHLLIGLGTAAAENGYRVKYTLATRLVNELVEAADEKQLARTIARYGRVDLLLIDELGYMELDRRGAEMLFQVLTEREEKNSVAIASNESFSGWTKTFTDPRLCAAIVDRLTFNGTIIETGTDSYRLAHTKQQSVVAAYFATEPWTRNAARASRYAGGASPQIACPSPAIEISSDPRNTAWYSSATSARTKSHSPRTMRTGRSSSLSAGLESNVASKSSLVSWLT